MPYLMKPPAEKPVKLHKILVTHSCIQTYIYMHSSIKRGFYYKR